jgi:hypothetical protein
MAVGVRQARQQPVRAVALLQQRRALDGGVEDLDAPGITGNYGDTLLIAHPPPLIPVSATGRRRLPPQAAAGQALQRSDKLA